MAEKTRLMHILISNSSYEQIKTDIKRIDASKRGRPMSIAAWVRAAIDSRLRMVKRMAPKRGKRNFVCAKCNVEKPKSQIAVIEDLLTGEHNCYCSSCRPF